MYSSWKNDLPEGWCETPPFGELIDNTFFPMKCLIDNQEVPPDIQFSPETLKEKLIEGMKLNIGLVINLTYTQKYYDERDLKDASIEFQQITCRGFNEAPQPKERDEFIKICDTFLSRNPKKKIAVHCTHGFNRTGFMICYYLCAVRDWSVEAAIAEFSIKRPPGIYKQEYINELCNLFGDSDDPIIEAATKPVWEFSSDPDDTGGTMAALNSGINNNNLIFYEGITEVALVRDEKLKQRIYKHCCQLCQFQLNSTHINFPGAQPVSMDLHNINLLRAHRYRVSWKADGCRYMMYIQDEENIFFLTRNLHLWRVSNLKFPKLEDLNSHLADTLLDGEMVTDTINGHKVHRFLIYDVISLDGNIVAKEHFDKRCYLIKCVIVEARRRAKQANLIPADGEPFKVADKGFFHLQHTRKTLNLDVPHEKDGLIFQPVDEPYTGGTCPGILKWKPPSHNSIDFRLVIREVRENGCIPEAHAFLHVSNRAEPTIKFKLSRDQSSFHQYNNKIVEMTLKDGKWVIMRERTDKLTPNSYETARATYNSITKPVTEQILLDVVASIPPEPKR